MTSHERTDPTVVLRCRISGEVVEVIRDDLACCPEKTLGRRFPDIVNGGSILRAQSFLESVQTGGSEFDWGLIVGSGNAARGLHFGGMCVPGRQEVLIVGASSAETMIATLRDFTEQLPPAPVADHTTFEQFLLDAIQRKDTFTDHPPRNQHARGGRGATRRKHQKEHLGTPDEQQSTGIAQGVTWESLLRFGLLLPDTLVARLTATLQIVELRESSADVLGGRKLKSGIRSLEDVFSTTTAQALYATCLRALAGESTTCRVVDAGISYIANAIPVRDSARNMLGVALFIQNIDGAARG